MTHITSTTSAESVLMRLAAADDSARIRTLAMLDDQRLPAGPFLVAEANGEIVAARSLSTGTAVADPFRLTSDIVAMLQLRAGQLGTVVSERGARRPSGHLALAA
jgi:hypothetical protein